MVRGQLHRFEGAKLVSKESGSTKRATERLKTAHLKLIPASKAERVELRNRCRLVSAGLEKSRPLGKDELESLARRILSESNLPEGYVGWTMVALLSEFWREQVAAIPPARRLFLLPHCPQHNGGRPADSEKVGLECAACGVCKIGEFRTTAEDLGYKVLVPDGSPTVLNIIVSGRVDAVVGVASLNVLEKAIDKILLAGIPCMAVPLLADGCDHPTIDEEWVLEMIRVPHVEKKPVTRSFVHLLRAASQLFQPDELERLAPRTRGEVRAADWQDKGIGAIDPIAGTEAIAYEFLTRGGKHLRPFVTLAIYDALLGGKATGDDGAHVIQSWPDHVKRAAMSIETFHKASLVHDDIEDGDEFRYGSPALHRVYGVPTAINVGDYLIGLGYRLVSREAKAMGGDCAAEILNVLADSHQRLSEGQGAELLWREAEDKRISPVDALRIYALKTAPAFEAAFLMGVRLAGPLDGYVAPIKKIARDLGIAFQILNDLSDWHGDQSNKMTRGLDLIGGRPTLLWALAHQDLNEAGRRELERMVADDSLTDAFRIQRAAQLYFEAGVGEKADRLVDKYRRRAEETAAQFSQEALGDVLVYLIDLMLVRPGDVHPTIQFIEPSSLRQALPVNSH